MLYFGTESERKLKAPRRPLSLRVTAKQRLQRNEWFKDMGRDNPDQGLQIHHKGTVHQIFSAKQGSKENMHCQFFQCFSSLDFVYGTLVRFFCLECIESGITARVRLISITIAKYVLYSPYIILMWRRGYFAI